MPTLQVFIENNVGKVLGSDKYVWDDVLLYTRHNLATNFHSIEVCLSFLGAGFVNCLDDREIGDHVEFYKWLKEKFIPSAKKGIARVLSKEVDNDIQV